MGPTLILSGRQRGRCGPNRETFVAKASGDVPEVPLVCDAKCMTHVAREFRAVERIEMKAVHAAIDQVGAQLGTDGSRQKIFASVAFGLFEGIYHP